jgi:hypothetical protein
LSGALIVGRKTPICGTFIVVLLVLVSSFL